jgi:hypothetical protein
MPDIVYTSAATVRRAAADAVPSKGEGPNLKVVTATKSLASPAQNSTHKFGRFDTNARLHGASRIYWDDLASSGAPTLDIGLAPVNSNFTADPDALNDGLDAATATPTGAAIIKDHANFGKTLWELAGLTSDPGGQIDVYVSVVDAAGNLTGDVTLEMFISHD